MKSRFILWLELGKVRITLAVSITTLTGYLLYSPSLRANLLLTVAGIFLLASGASALNQMQEFRFDSQMERTRRRPLPSGRISPAGTLAVILAYSFAGGGLLFMGTGWAGLALGILAYFWYNVVYTYLKRLTPWAMIPGSLIGSIPPVIGWISAGGSVTDPMVLSIAAFFYIWQVPHFWLLVLKYGREYQSAGFPSLSNVMTELRMRRRIFLWIVGTALTAVGFTFYGPLDSLISKAGLWMASAWLVLTFSSILKRSLAEFQPGKYFMRINYFVLLAIAFMCLDKMLLKHVAVFF